MNNHLDKDSKLKQSLRRRLDKSKKQENLPVFIKDLVVYPENPSFSYGESKSHTNHYSSHSMINRLVDHIQSLADIANCYHKKSYCLHLNDRSYKLKEDSLNKITRLSLNEFSLYGKTPLTQDEFNLVCKEVQKIAKNLQDNVHLVLSSFSVVNEKKEILNVSLYVQGGQDSKIEVISKCTASSIDVVYNNTSTFSQRPSDQVGRYVVDDNGSLVPVSNSSVFEIQTKGGAKYIQALDVCLDHANRHSKKQLQSQLTRDRVDVTYFIPEQVDHIVTSNSIRIENSSLISQFVLHVDPRVETIMPAAIDCNLDKNLLSEMELSNYKNMKIMNQQYGLKVIAPPFGSNYSVKVHEERQLNKFVPFLASYIDRENYRIMEERLDTIMMMHSSDEVAFAKAYAAKNSKAIAEIYAKYPNVDYVTVVEKIISGLDKQARSAAKEWFYQEVIKNELNKRLSANIHTVLTALQYGIDFYQPFGSLHLGEQIMAQAYMTREPRIIAELYAKFPNIHLIGSVNKIAATFYPQTQEDVKKWLCQEIIKNELNKRLGANTNTILTALQYGIDFYQPFGSLHLGEQIMAQAYMTREPRIIAELYAKFPNIHLIGSVNKIAATFYPQTQEDVKKWLCQEIIKNELNKGLGANTNTILTALQYGIDFYQPFGSLHLPPCQDSCPVFYSQ
ncbi:Uncharacterised protein [Legionella londiniensis]|uniref:Uncharacterized protein n=2 Tax=Legionella londiniensis TaxID=45068 RepID=A0A0W0VMX8_9GAMM|nr:hypothetical protein [Legionella londiniensis]KTD21395.1 hypothetical protein Llon_1493 [Legionella londiniensis]STX93548.1 Uncharacterised protein [Legionella londiniensis]